MWEEKALVQALEVEAHNHQEGLVEVVAVGVDQIALDIYKDLAAGVVAVEVTTVEVADRVEVVPVADLVM
jgi:acylphosphatase